MLLCMNYLLLLKGVPLRLEGVTLIMNMNIHVLKNSNIRVTDKRMEVRNEETHVSEVQEKNQKQQGFEEI